MRRHFTVLVVGSLVYLALSGWVTIDVIVGGSDPAAGALRNTANILKAVGQLGLFVVFAALVLGHGLLRHPAARQTSGGEESGLD